MGPMASGFGEFLAARGAPHPINAPELFRGVILARMLALFWDAFYLFLLSAGLTLLGLWTGFVETRAGWSLMLGLLWVLYFGVTLGIHGATPGMDHLGLKALSGRGRAPGFFRGTLHATAFYAFDIVLGPLVLLAALLSPRKRFLHDLLAGVVVISTRPR